MDDSSKILEYLIAVEKLAEEILSDKRSIMLLDKRRNDNREALRTVQKQGKEKCWITIGSNIMKCSTTKILKLIDKDQQQLDIEISKLRTDLKIKVNQLKDLECEPPVPGLMLVPLTKEESKVFSDHL